jgi:hypothetical protein
VLFADRSYAASLEPFYLITICSFEWTEDGDVTWLQFIGCVGGQATKYDLVLKSELKNFKGFVGAKAVTNEHTRALSRSVSRLRIKH